MNDFIPIFILLMLSAIAFCILRIVVIVAGILFSFRWHRQRERAKAVEMPAWQRKLQLKYIVRKQ